MRQTPLDPIPIKTRGNRQALTPAHQLGANVGKSSLSPRRRSPRSCTRAFGFVRELFFFADVAPHYTATNRVGFRFAVDRDRHRLDLRVCARPLRSVGRSFRGISALFLVVIGAGPFPHSIIQCCYSGARQLLFWICGLIRSISYRTFVKGRISIKSRSNHEQIFFFISTCIFLKAF